MMWFPPIPIIADRRSSKSIFSPIRLNGIAPDDRSKRRVKTADTLFEILSSLQSMNGATLVELADELEFAKSTIHGHLASLESNEYVIRNDNVYELSHKFLEHGMFVKNNRPISRMGVQFSRS